MSRMDWMQWLTEELDLPGEPLPGQPVAELAGTQRVLIERHKGVTQYSPEQICIRMAYGFLMVQGCGLELVRMTREQLVISGRVDGLRVIRR